MSESPTRVTADIPAPVCLPRDQLAHSILPWLHVVVDPVAVDESLAAPLEREEKRQVMRCVGRELDDIIEPIGDVPPAVEGTQLAIDEQHEAVLPERVYTVIARDHEAVAVLLDPCVRGLIRRNRQERISDNIDLDRLVLL